MFNERFKEFESSIVMIELRVNAGYKDHVQNRQVAEIKSIRKLIQGYLTENNYPLITLSLSKEEGQILLTMIDSLHTTIATLVTSLTKYKKNREAKPLTTFYAFHSVEYKQNILEGIDCGNADMSYLLKIKDFVSKDMGLKSNSMALT